MTAIEAINPQYVRRSLGAHGTGVNQKNSSQPKTPRAPAKFPYFA
jgi:hypothetical protein